MSQFRGRFGGRGRGSRFLSNRPSWRRVQDEEATPTAPLGSILSSVSLDSLDDDDDNKMVACINGSELVGSFNLLAKPASSIAVPGMPAKWTPLQNPPVLKEDADTYYRDVNAAHNLQGPWQATVDTMMRQAQSKSFDILACGSTLGNLLRFVGGKQQSCRLLVNNIGGVVHLTRRESTPKATIPDIYGYGLTFPEAYTTWDKSVKCSTSHQRIVRYSFAGIDIVVRAEADGYLADKAGNLEPAASMRSKTRDDPKKTTMNDLNSAFAELNSEQSVAREVGSLKAINAGISVPQCAVFDLKTRTIKRQGGEAAIMAGEIPRLWVRQIPNFILGFHDNGRFVDIKVKDIREDVLAWEAEQQPKLRRLAKLLQRIIEAVEAAPLKKMEITMDEGKNELHFRE